MTGTAADHTTPFLPGFYPDPSICRVGDNYYVATSSFEYVPGVPIHRSRDLHTWELVGHAFAADAVGEAAVGAIPGAAGAGGGIYAPTLRHHDDLFYLVTTSIGAMTEGHLITHAADAAGPWSAPVHISGAVGIDPDLTWDEDGTCLLTWADPRVDIIYQAAVDPDAGRLLEEPRELTRGSGYADPEAPHLFLRDGWWYLVLAEGGTHLGHAVTVFRSRSARGPFEEHPNGPLLTHRSTDHAVQAAGHADLAERPDGSWVLVHLGIRQRGSFPGFHTNGRESFLRIVRWQDGWPVVADEVVRHADAPAWVDGFAHPELDGRWISPGVSPTAVATVTEAGVRLVPSREPDAADGLATLCTRAVSDLWQAAAHPGDGDVALTLRIDGAHWCGVERVGSRVRARVVIGPADAVLASADWDGAEALCLRAQPIEQRRGGRAGPDQIVMGVLRNGSFEELARADGRYLSTEAAGGFTGRVIALEALGDHATVARFAYDPS